jgi:hypothetical protein
MRLKLVRCMICSGWFGGQRKHCPYCAAAKIALGNETYMHLNAHTGKVITSGLSRYHFRSNALEIARELMST